MPEGPRRSFWRRFAIGALTILLASSGASAVAAFDELDRLVDALRSDDIELGGELAEADAGSPQTVMLIGSDKRAPTARDARLGLPSLSDTVILVRLDPSKKATALMSLPRDLKVFIPGHGTGKLNSAYALGGSRLTLQTVKELTGLGINHLINVDFRGFREGVDSIGCVYVDVDRRYFNDNSGFEEYASIDVKPGYQPLCGQDALDYVRYRHEDNDLVRSARQQEFLRQAKQQVGVKRLLRDRKKLLEVFGRYARSDIADRSAALRLLKLAIVSARYPIREVHFEGKIGESFVTASSSVVKELTDQFLGVQETLGPRGQLPGVPDRPSPERRSRSASPSALGLEDASTPGEDQAAQARAAGARLPVFYPTRRTFGSLFTGPPRVYEVPGPGGRKFPAYRMVIKRGRIGEYYGVQGTAWKEPPILDDPSERRVVGGREFELHYDGDRLRLVAWRTDKGVYWVSNTLLQTLSERQMIEIARSARPL